MKTKFITIALLFCSIMVANAVEYREVITVVASSTPQYPECNRVYKTTQVQDIFTPGGWRTVNVELIEDTCNNVE